jgi:hypothetical protein
MYRRRGIVMVVLLLVVFLAAIGIFGLYLFQKQQNKVPGTVLNKITALHNTVTPFYSPSSIPNSSPIPTETSTCDCSWAISSGTNVEFLITSPSGQQEGYLQSSNSYIKDLPDAYYGVEPGIADETGQNPPQPDMLQFGQSNPQNGIYDIQVIGKHPGNYHLDILFAWGPSNTEKLSFEGILNLNQIDKYKVTFPDGTVEKVNQ